MGNLTQPNNLPHLYAKVIGVLFFCGLILPWLLPSFITQTFKPLAIFTCFSLILLWRIRLRIGFNQVIAIFSILYYIAVFIGYQITTVSVIEFVSTTMYMLMFLVSTIVLYSEKDVKFILKSVFFASLIFAIITFISNPFIGSGTSRASMNFLYAGINGNLIPYAILPGFVVGLQAFVYGKKYRNTGTLVALLIMLYSIFLPATRGAFMALLAIIFLTFYGSIKHFAKNRGFLRIFGFSLLFVLMVIIIIKYLPENISNRLFDFDSYSDSSSRTEIYNAAWNMAQQNIWFGSGFSEWASTYTFAVHNTYLELLISTGVIGASLLIVIVFNSIIKMKSSILYAFFTISIVESLVETGGAYTFWIPIIVAVLLRDYCKRQNYTVDQFYRENF